MTETVKKLTPEEELVNAASTTADDADGDGTEIDDRSPEQKLIQDLESKLTHAEERARSAEDQRDAERHQKDAARTEAKTAAQKQVLATEISHRNAVAAAKSAFESAQKEWDDAFDSGDKTSVRKAQEKLNDAQSMLRSAEYQNAQFDNWKKQTGGVVSNEQSRFSKAELDWIDKNPRFNTDRKFRAGVYAAHEEAVQKGIEIDSPAYFKNVEDYLSDIGLKDEAVSSDQAQKKEEPVKKEQKKSEKQGSSTAIPPGGASGSSSGSGKKQTFHMTSEHREAAAVCYPELHRKDPKAAEEKYAVRQLEIQQKKAKGEL